MAEQSPSQALPVVRQLLGSGGYNGSGICNAITLNSHVLNLAILNQIYALPKNILLKKEIK